MGNLVAMEGLTPTLRAPFPEGEGDKDLSKITMMYIVLL